MVTGTAPMTSTGPQGNIVQFIIGLIVTVFVLAVAGVVLFVVWKIRKNRLLRFNTVNPHELDEDMPIPAGSPFS